ncbi:putative SUR7/PalI family-domain-containing protein [Seiridium unicorne]|uniref:SUR7/PalI family-domain-containing protein n=1 Tax=Seiridium unicorne TaxID=138068 RepID=A0ABR2V1I1_9PEZI
MGNVGRFFCVALPFILTGASIICMLIAGLTGVTNNASLYILRANVTGLTISPASIASVLDIASRDVSYHDASLLGGSSSGSSTDGTTPSGTSGSAASSASSAASSTSGTASTSLTSNITAADLALADLYDINLWGYCTTDDEGSRNCSKAQFNWASTALNTSSLTDFGSSAGYNITLPTELTSSLTAFKTVTKWTEVVYIIAMVALGIELFAGIFTYCSRAVSCVTYLISGIATVAVCATAAMITAMAVIVVGAIEGTAKFYGVSGSINTSFLATVWLGAAFAIAASLFWLFSACCCKRDHNTRRSKNHDDEKPFLPGNSYAPLHDNHRGSYGYNQQAYAAPRHNNARSDLAYEPYSHSNV